VSLLTLLALGMWLLLAVGGTLVFAVLPQFLVDQGGWSYEQVLPLLNVIDLARSTISVAAMILMLAAMFSGRSRSQVSPRETAENGPSWSGMKSVERL
jgi:hypothetical protein